MTKFLLIALSLLNCQFAISSTNCISTKSFGNIVVSIMTPNSKMQIIDDAWILGKMAQKLSEQYDFDDTLIVNINYSLFDEDSSIYFLSHSKGFDFRYYDYSYFKSKNFELYSKSSNIDFVEKLKLIEYIFLNSIKIKTDTKFTYDAPPMEALKSIDKRTIKKILKSPISKEINNVLKSETSQLFKHEDYIGITYFYSDSSYKITAKNQRNSDSVILEIKSIKSFQPINRVAVFICDSDSSFYFVSNLFSKNISVKRKSIKPPLKSNRNYKFSEINDNFFYLNDIYYREDSTYEPFFKDTIQVNKEYQRLLIYDSKHDILIQDMDSLIKKNFR